MNSSPLALRRLLASGALAWALLGLTSPAELAAQETRDEAPSDEAAASLSALVERVQTAYDGLEDFTARFTQEYTNQALDETRRSAGVVHFMRPGRMRWDYLEPTLRLFISDGDNLWIYEPEQAQYYTQSLADSDLPTALRFMMGEGRLADDFEISLDRSSTPEAPVLLLVPRQSEGQYTRLRLRIDPATHFVAETTIYDPAGNTNRIRFDGSEFNVGYEPGDFVFEAPEGASRVDTPSP